MFLVTGGFGFIGSHTCVALLDAGYDVVATRHRRAEFPLPQHQPQAQAQPQRQPQRQPQPQTGGRLFAEPLDITEWDQWSALGKRHRITGLIHLAAAAIERPPAEQLTDNFAGLMNAIRAADEWGLERIVVASTIGVYAGVNTDGLYTESLGLPPIGLHGIQASKKIGEIAGDLVSRSGKVQVVSARLPAVWGPLGNPSSRFFALPALVHAASAGQQSNAPAGGGIDAMYVSDVARALVALATSAHLSHNIYNVGTGHATTNAEIIAAIKACIPTAQLQLDETDTAGAPFALDPTRLIEDTGFRTQHSLVSGIADYLTWLENGHST